jgi:hypothetical protein
MSGSILLRPAQWGTHELVLRTPHGQHSLALSLFLNFKAPLLRAVEELFGHCAGAGGGSNTLSGLHRM